MLPIYLRNLPPTNLQYSQETFAHPEFLMELAKWIKPERYLELGVRDGKTFTQVAPLCKVAVGVDVGTCQFCLKPNMEYHLMTTDAYFKSIQGTDILFDMVFIDADHSHEQSLLDFTNVIPYVIEDGFIFLHDTYPYSDTLMAKDKSYNTYLTALYIKQNMANDFEIVTLPFNPGLSIIKKMPKHKQITYL
jgi:hypothetical protein